MSRQPVLIITYGFPPHSKSLGGSIRMLKLAEFLHDRGNDVTVLCARTPHHDTFGYDALLSRLRIVYVDDPAARWASRIVRSAPSAPAVGAAAAGWRSHFKRIALAALTPDTAVTVLGRFKKAADAWAAAHPDGTVITSGPPHSVHLLGRWLRKRYLRLQWLVDYRDSWNGTSLFRKRNVLLQRLNLHLERQVLRGCDGLTYISRPMLSKASALIGTAVTAKGHLVTNGFDAALLGQMNRTRRPAGPLRLGYFGAIDDAATSYRNPKVLFEAMLARPELAIRLELFGAVQVSPEWSRRLGERLFIGGKLAHDEALQTMAGMDVLLLLHTRDDGADEVVTGKVFEYIATGLPIVSIGPREMAVNELLAEDEAAFPVSHHDGQAIAALLERLAEAHRSDRLPVRDASRLTSYTREHQFKVFERLVAREPA